MAQRVDDAGRTLPPYADTVVVGGGTAGAAVAGLLAERGDGTVLLLEAGPDYGSFDGGRWPADALDARALCASHGWGYTSEETYPGRVVTFERARLIGGCSSHNGCAAIWGHRLDYDGWVARGNPGWDTDDLLPLFREATARLRVRKPAPEEVTPYQAAWLEAAPGAGVPLVDDLNDLDGDVGMSASPVNIDGGVRWNTAFAFLDSVRARPNLMVAGDAPVDRLLLDGDRATSVVVVGPNGSKTVEADRVILSAGTYGSPAILLRSGVGEPEALRAAGVEPRHALPGVGRNLHDHPAVEMSFAGSPELEARMAAFSADRWTPEEQTIAKARSSACREAFDLHLYPVGGPDPAARQVWRWLLPIACMTPRSRGRLTLRGPDPTLPPRIDHRYLSDPDGADVRVLADGLALGRAMAAQPALASLLGEEIKPGPQARTTADLTAYAEANCVHYYHPVGTCAMGPESEAEGSDPVAVVDSRGKIHGLANAYVADASVIPVIPRANTNLPALVVGMRIAGWLR